MSIMNDMKTTTGHKQTKLKKMLTKIMIALAIILVIELIIFVFYKLTNKKECMNVFSKKYEDVLVIDDGYITIGNNDYDGTEDEKHNKDHLLKQGEIVKLDKDLNTIWTTAYYLDVDVYLTGITKASNGYIVIGYKDSNDEKTGIILKLDKDGKIVNSIEYDLLNDTKLNKIVRDNNNNIIIGSSIYEPNQVGNHLGGGIILKVDDNLNILEENNYGGNKSGEFFNIFVLDDSYLVYGVDAGYPIVVKFAKNFHRLIDDQELISKKVIYNKTLDKEVIFNPLYYGNNKLYDGNKEYDFNTENIVNNENKVLEDKTVLLIDNNYIYAVDSKKLYKYNLKNELIEEIEVDFYITKVIPINNTYLVIGNECKKCDCNSTIKMLSRH